MLHILWDVRGYFFWLLAVSALCWGLERLFAWRWGQKAWRAQFGQDLFWLVFNGHYLGVGLAVVADVVLQRLVVWAGGWPWPAPESLALLKTTPLWLQFVVFLVFKDLLEWGVHNLLHRVPWLWTFHKLHHSIAELDWIGNMRFHWMEVVVYKSLTYLPLVVLGIDGRVILWVAIFGTLVGHLNHANLPWDWGPLRFLFNSPRFHVWHHDVVQHGRGGQNFAVVFSLWDWLFGTAYSPTDRVQPERLGFADDAAFPQKLLPRLLYPLKWPLFRGRRDGSR